MKLLPSWHILCIPYNRAPCHFMQSHIHKVPACSAVACHLHVWQNDRDLCSPITVLAVAQQMVYSCLFSSLSVCWQAAYRDNTLGLPKICPEKNIPSSLSRCCTTVYFQVFLCADRQHTETTRWDCPRSAPSRTYPHHSADAVQLSIFKSFCVLTGSIPRQHAGTAQDLPRAEHTPHHSADAVQLPEECPHGGAHGGGRSGDGPRQTCGSVSPLLCGGEESHLGGEQGALGGRQACGQVCVAIHRGNHCCRFSSLCHSTPQGESLL